MEILDTLESHDEPSSEKLGKQLTFDGVADDNQEKPTPADTSTTPARDDSDGGGKVEVLQSM